MTQCVISPPWRDSAAGWLRPLGGRHRYHPAKGSGWLRSLTIANHYHPAKGSFARFPSGASLNATMQFALLPSELGQNLSFSGAKYIATALYRFASFRYGFWRDGTRIPRRSRARKKSGGQAERIPPPPPLANNTNSENGFVLFFAVDYFCIIVERNYKSQPEQRADRANLRTIQVIILLFFKWIF